MLPERIAVIGSSSVHGMIDPEGGGFVGRLRSWHEVQYFKNRVYNLGIPGETTVQMLDRLHRELAPRKPQLVLIQSGTNDARRRESLDAECDTPVDQYTAKIHNLIDTASEYAQVGFIGVYPINDSKTQPLSYWGKNAFYAMDDITRYAEVVESVCTERSIPHLNMMDIWSNEEYDQYIFEDGLHANSKGHQMMFELCKSFLDDNFTL